MKLRLYHHHDGARIAYREAGTGTPIVLLHSALLSHREWEPLVEYMSDRFRLVLPDLPLHGDSEENPRHPYSPDWLADVIAGFCRETLGPRPIVGGHGFGAELLLRTITTGRLQPARIVLMNSLLHAARRRPLASRGLRAGAQLAVLPVLDRGLAHAIRLAARPKLGDRLSARGNPAARDVVRHAFADVGGNGNRARAWAKMARRWPTRPQRELLNDYARIAAPVLLLWADCDPWHPLAIAEQALERLPDADLRVLPDTGFLITYDDPVGVARELAAFCK